MIGCTFKEYLVRFENDLANHLVEFEDHSLISFIDNQKILYNLYQQYLYEIFGALMIYNEENASEVFLESNIFNGLKKLDIESYQYIIIEEKPNVSPKGSYLYVAKVGEIRSEFLVRVNLTALKNIIARTNRILEYLEEKELEFQNIKSTIDDKSIIESGEFEIKTETDPNQQIIDEHLGLFKSYISEADYKALSNSLIQYFKTGNFPKLKKSIDFDPINKKWIGWALKVIHKKCTRKKLSIEMLFFAKENINLFKEENINKENFRNSSFYKSFTEKPNSYKYREIHQKHLKNH